MIYLTGANGLVGSRLSVCLGDMEVTKISYRDEVPDVFESHEKSCSFILDGHLRLEII